MPPPATKQRKTEHTPSDDDGDDDNASFASFGSGDDHATEVSEQEQDHEVEEEMRLDVSEEDGSDDDDDDEGINSKGIVPPSRASTKAKVKPATTIGSAKLQTKSSKTSQLSSSAYASGTFKSNVFKLQVDELLSQIRPKHGRREIAAEAALHALKITIEQIPARGPNALVDAERDLLREKVAIPFPEPPPARDVKYKFAYAKPAYINVAGSHPLKTASKSQDVLEVDMVVCMPTSIFQEKDYLNYRYFYKRAYYLACIAVGLKSAHKSEYMLRFRLFHDDPLKPVLVVSPADDTSSDHKAPSPKWRVNIILCIAENQFPARKLAPGSNCIRVQDETQEAEYRVTPQYNSSLRADMLVTSYLKLLHSTGKACRAFVDACLLGRTWLRQRGFSSAISSGGFGSFEWSALIALCLTGGSAGGKPLLSPGYSSYQLFKATLQLIATKDFSRQPLVIGEAAEAASFKAAVPLVWDVERENNILYKVQAWAYRILRYEARTTISTLGDQLHDGFDATFIMRVQEPLHRYDQLINIPFTAIKPRARLSDVHESTGKIFEILKRGLGDRVYQIAFILPSSETWKVGSAVPLIGPSVEFRIGLFVNPDTVRRIVDHGPAAENKGEAASFREFWGERAELRRFKDGSILESLVWSSAHESGQSVVEQIVRHILSRHFGPAIVEGMTFTGEAFSKLVRGGAERNVFEPLLTRYNQFENDLRDLRDLPLTIRQIMPADAQLRCASLQALSRKARPNPADVTIQFEGSGRWPDDLAAIQRTKIAFLLKIKEMLQESVDSVDTRIGLENEGQEALNQGFLDVTYDLEATFRLRIYHDREQTLHERRLKDKNVDPKSKEVSAIGLAKYKRDYIKTPALTQAVARLSTRFPALSGTVRLVKRWFASHLLANHIADEVIELLVVRTFTHSWPWQTPSSVQTGFLRTLFWISRWDWRAEPLAVDLSASGELKQPDMKIINTNFEAWRKLDPRMNRVALFVATNLDHDGNTWTDSQPAKVVAGRMTALAKAACAEVAEKQLQLEPLSLFSSTLEDFDFVLHINPIVAGTRPKTAETNGSTIFKNLELETLSDTTMIGFDPVQDMLQELESLYGSAILFFSGGSERHIIAGLWSPLTARRTWKVNLAYSTIPRKRKGEEDDEEAELNKTAILAEIARIGGDLIDKIEVIGH